MDLWAETRALLAKLEAEDLDYALVGAVALAVHGAPRATTDVDLLIRPEDLEAISDLARTLGFVFEALPMRFADGMEVRRRTKIEDGETLTLDLLLLNPNLESVWSSRQRIEADFGNVRVISRESLIRMKVWAGRDQDLADVARLKDLDR